MTQQGAPVVSDADVRRYLGARASAVAARGAVADDMALRVAVAVGLLPRRRARRVRLLRLAVVVAALVGLLAVGYGTGVLPPQPAPSVRPAPTPSALASLAPVAYPGAAVAATDDAVWVADAAGELAELDPTSGAVLRRVDLPRRASVLLITTDSVWASSDAGDLVRVDRASLAFTPIIGAVGVALTASTSAIWLGGTDEVIRIDPGTNAVSLRVPVAGRSPDLGIAAVDDAVWVATRSQILRLDGASGATTGSIPGDASRLLASSGRLWAVRGTELLQIDVDAASIVSLTPGVPGTGTIAAAFERIWVAGPAGGGGFGSVVGVAVAGPTLDITGALPASVAQLAVGAGGVWITPDVDEPTRQLYRFAAP